MTSYFSDAELGSPPAVHDELPLKAWGGIVATFYRMADVNLFAVDFPVQCDDGKGVVGTSMAGIRATLLASVPAFDDWPREESPPGTVPAMDLVVFGWKHAAQPIVSSRHDFFGHDHLSFDQAAGRTRWREEINEILRRNGVALRQEADGRVMRVDPVAAQLVTARQLPSSGDASLDEKLDTALRKYRDPDVAVRREALEALWDAFERVKTLLLPDGTKASSAEELIALMAPSLETRKRLTLEFADLTKVGNDFQIRHHEMSKHPVDAEVIDHWFVRTFSLVEYALRAVAAKRGSDA